MTNKSALVALVVVAMFVAVPFFAAADESEATGLINIQSDSSGVSFSARGLTEAQTNGIDEMPDSEVFTQTMLASLDIRSGFAGSAMTLSNYSISNIDLQLDIADSINDSEFKGVQSYIISADITVRVTVGSSLNGVAMFMGEMKDSNDYRELKNKLTNGDPTFHTNDRFDMVGRVTIGTGYEEKLSYEDVSLHDVFATEFNERMYSKKAVQLTQFIFTRGSTIVSADSVVSEVEGHLERTGVTSCPESTFELNVGDHAQYALSNSYSVNKNSYSVRMSDGSSYRYEMDTDAEFESAMSEHVVSQTAVFAKEDIADYYKTINYREISSTLSRSALKELGTLSESYDKAYNNVMDHFDGKSKNHTVLIIVIVAVVVLAGAGIAVFFIIRKKNSVEAPADEAECIVQEDEEPKQ